MFCTNDGDNAGNSDGNMGTTVVVTVMVVGSWRSLTLTLTVSAGAGVGRC